MKEKKPTKAVQKIIDWLLEYSKKDESKWIHPRDLAEAIKRGDYLKKK